MWKIHQKGQVEDSEAVYEGGRYNQQTVEDDERK